MTVIPPTAVKRKMPANIEEMLNDFEQMDTTAQAMFLRGNLNIQIFFISRYNSILFVICRCFCVAEERSVSHDGDYEHRQQYDPCRRQIR